MAHPVVNRLRGRAEPREDILNRLEAINHHFRVNWVPSGRPIEKDGETYQRPAMWRIYEHRPHPLRTAAAHANLQRFGKWSRVKQEANPGLVYDLEDKVDGLHLVAEFSEEYFGTDRMFEDLRESERNLASFRDDVTKAQQRQASDEIEEEMQSNPEFSDYVREVAKDYYSMVKGNSVVSMATGAK